jgi:hypothetical protein
VENSQKIEALIQDLQNPDHAVRLYFDGKGNWGLESAFPNPQ